MQPHEKQKFKKSQFSRVRANSDGSMSLNENVEPFKQKSEEQCNLDIESLALVTESSIKEPISEGKPLSTSEAVTVSAGFAIEPLVVPE